MILSQLRQFIKQRGRVSLDELAIHFDGDKSAIEGMVDVLKTRGIVLELGCGGCGGSKTCSVSGPKIYAWNSGSSVLQQKDGSVTCRSSS